MWPAKTHQRPSVSHPSTHCLHASPPGALPIRVACRPMPSTLPCACRRCHRPRHYGHQWSGAVVRHSCQAPTIGQLSSSSIRARYLPRKPADGKEAGHSRNEQGSLLYALLSRLSRAGRDRQSGGEMPTRTFIAIELGDAARPALVRTSAALARELPVVRFVEPASLHLTLAFLADLDDPQLEQATQATPPPPHLPTPTPRTLALLRHP